MKFDPWYLVAIAPFAMLGFGAFVGHVLVLLVTLAIFFGTLSLGKPAAPSASSSPTSADSATLNS